MAITTVVIDPQGDTLIVLPHATEPDDADISPKTEDDPLDTDGHDPKEHAPCLKQDADATHFKVSKKHLALASPRAQAMFAGGFQESIPKEDGFCHWNFEPIFDPEAFEIIMNIIHGKSRSLPLKIEFEMLACIATVVDDLQCHEAVWFVAKKWLNDIRKRIPSVICKDLASWILISYVFDEPKIFTASTQSAILRSDGPMPTFDLPIRPHIIDEIDRYRQEDLESLINHVHDLISRLCRKEIGCDYGCRSIMLGALLQGLSSGMMYSPRPSKPFLGLSVHSTLETLRSIESPDYFCADESHNRPRESWQYSEDRYSDGPSTFKTRKPGSTIEGNNKVSGIPRQLVYHSCSLKELLEPEVNNISRQGVGLSLEEYINL
ncbi:hypothetical protein EDB81DRAFT_778430 [Dactylonectria macrodidyma]|uniref:BTB domain-containing protein n=1 Tax=Dactylonectria macrodidyma TaxID=307937 RepID=A0A9P9FRU2_9HYPO|nr:hypothetical protein EDB81DRAFT_778430 [Dactylonectria macrodidyma]